MMLKTLFSSNTFASLDLHPHLVDSLEKLQLKLLTNVQEKSIPLILQGKNLLANSETGSGKTLAYVVPIVHRLQAVRPKISRTQGIMALIILPTRELVLQCYNIVEQLSKSFVWIVPGQVSGGEKRKSEKSRLRKGVNILVATPGRLIDHIEHTVSLKLNNLQFLVVDEADRMYEMGFCKSIETVIASIKEHQADRYQSILLSATLTPGVEKFVNLSLGPNAERIDCSSTKSIPDSDTSHFKAPDNLSQFYTVVTEKQRILALAAFIIDKCMCSEKSSKMLVFLSTQSGVEFLYKLFTVVLNGELFFGDEQKQSTSKSISRPDIQPVKLFSLSGDLPQTDRKGVFLQFSKSRNGVLLATDVACRGLDLVDISWIVQMTPPATPTDYIHRVGRTARIGREGNALLFLLNSEQKYVQFLKSYNMSLSEMPCNTFISVLSKVISTPVKDKTKKQDMRRALPEAIASLQRSLEETVYQDTDGELLVLARSAYQSFVKAYSTYPAESRSFFHARALHLGHVAKSFCLRDPPSAIQRALSKQRALDKGNLARSSKPPAFKRKRSSGEVSEFSSGFHIVPKQTSFSFKQNERQYYSSSDDEQDTCMSTVASKQPKPDRYFMTAEQAILKQTMQLKRSANLRSMKLNENVSLKRTNRPNRPSHRNERAGMKFKPRKSSFGHSTLSTISEFI